MNVALEENDLDLIAATLEDISLAWRMVAADEGVGVNGESMSASGGIELVAALEAERFLGLQLRVHAATRSTD